VRSLPFYFESGPRGELAGGGAEPPGTVASEAAPAAARPAQASQPARGSAAERDRLPEELFFALVLMERDAERARYGPTSQRALEELVKLLAERDLETLRHTWRTLFSRIVEPAEDTRRAAELVGEHFRTS
jgi:hypothetical protein